MASEVKIEASDGTVYRLEEIVSDGDVYQIGRGVSDEGSEPPVAVKAPRFDPDQGAPEAARFEALEREAEFLEGAPERFPTFVDRTEIETPGGSGVPVLIYEYVPGETLYDHVAKRPREVLETADLLDVVREVGGTLRELHDSGWLFRNLDPRHVILDEEAEFRSFVGTGHCTPIGERPLRPSADYTEAAYVAPEARQERSGETIRPAADVYGLAAMASFAFTGEEPLAYVESPLTGRAYELLQRIEPAELANLVAAGLQPVAKHRAGLERFVAMAELESLPASDAAVGEADEIGVLPEPWEGARPPEGNRAERSRLSAGPLISVSRSESEGAAPAAGTMEEGSLQAEEGPASARTAPVREFLGETDHVGDAEAAGDSEPEADVRHASDGAPAREVSMVDEHLDGAEDSDASDEGGLPPLSELPFRRRLLIGVGIPFAAMLVVILLGVLGVY